MDIQIQVSIYPGAYIKLTFLWLLWSALYNSDKYLSVSLPWKPTVKFEAKWGPAYWFVSAGANLHWVHDKSILLASAINRELDNCIVNYNHDGCVWTGGGLTTRVECMCWRTQVQSAGADLWFILHYSGSVFCSKLDWTSSPSIYWDSANYHAYQVSGTHNVHDLVHLLLGRFQWDHALRIILVPNQELKRKKLWLSELSIGSGPWLELSSRSIILIHINRTCFQCSKNCKVL